MKVCRFFGTDTSAGTKVQFTMIVWRGDCVWMCVGTVCRAVLRTVDFPRKWWSGKLFSFFFLSFLGETDRTVIKTSQHNDAQQILSTPSHCQGSIVGGKRWSFWVFLKSGDWKENDWVRRHFWAELFKTFTVFLHLTYYHLAAAGSLSTALHTCSPPEPVCFTVVLHLQSGILTHAKLCRLK